MTGAIHGTVTDSTGAVLPGVTIVISSAALMGTRSTVTDAEGLYRFPALAPGEYTVVFTLDGFEAVRREGVYVALAFTATVNIEMPIATLQEKVIVERSSPALDKHSTAIATTFDARQLANLPSARSMWAIQAATPAVYLPRFDLGASATGLPGPISAYGTAGANRPMVEGISVSGINPTGFTLDYGVFEEVSVGTAAHGPEWPWPGVHMQFISKSGGNQYRGALYADYLNKDWQSFNIDEEQIRRGARGGPALSPREANRLSGYRDINADTWRIRQTRHALVVLLRSATGGFRPAGKLPGQAASDVVDELQRKGHVPGHAEQQARRVRAGGSELSAEPPRSLRPDRLQHRPGDGDQRVGGVDD